MKDLEHEASGNVFPGDLRERVSRQMILRELGEKGQAAISSAHFLVIGAGGLGSPAILYLAAAGAGTITVVDADTVSVSNLSRQILHTTSTVNVNKAKSAAIAVERLNPHCRIIPVPEFADAVKLKALVKNADVILDCTDNLATRIAVSRAAHDAGKPLVFASAVRFSGQLTVFDPSVPESPCFECIFEEDDPGNDVKAAAVGVFSSVTGIVGTLQATEALKIAAGIGSTLCGRMLFIDALNMQFDTIKVKRRKRLPRLRRKALTPKRAPKADRRNGPETKVRGRSVGNDPKEEGARLPTEEPGTLSLTSGCGAFAPQAHHLRIRRRT